MQRNLKRPMDDVTPTTAVGAAAVTHTEPAEQPTVANTRFASKAELQHNPASQSTTHEVTEVTFSTSEVKSNSVTNTFELLTPNDKIKPGNKVRQAKAK